MSSYLASFSNALAILHKIYVSTSNTPIIGSTKHHHIGPGSTVTSFISRKRG